MIAAATSITSGVYLRSLLAPLGSLMAREDLTDIYINKPGELWVETLGGAIEHHQLAELTEAMLGRLARQIAALSHQGISREHPLLSATLPDGARVQIVAPPATRGPMAIAIRKHVAKSLSLADYAADDAFREAAIRTTLNTAEVDVELAKMLAEGDVAGMLSAAVRSRRTILVSGGTSTGKTTFLNALLREVSAEERLILIEDTPELQVDHANMVGLLAARSALGEAQVTANDLVAASLRMRPDRIVLGELRGDEAYEQIALLILQGGTRLTREDVVHYVRSIVNVYVQLKRNGVKRVVSEVVLAC